MSYTAVRYDNSKYPAAPAGAQTDVFGFLLRSVRTPNGYLTCFEQTHHGDTSWGRAPVIAEIRWGPALTDCASPPPANNIHRVVFDYVDPSNMTFAGIAPESFPGGGAPYFSPTSFRMGAAVSANNLLTAIKVDAADFRPGATAPARQATYRLVYEPAAAAETRLPRLVKLVELEPSGSERTLKTFRYGSRLGEFDAQPKLLDVGPDADEFPASISGSVSRPLRSTNPLSNLLQLGHDQHDFDAPHSSASTQQWSMLDLNGDGLLDTHVADERGADPLNPWPTLEISDTTVPKPAQQWAFVNEGIVNGAVASTKVVLDTAAPDLAAKYPPDPLSGQAWIWQDGRGKTRESMPQSVSSPEIRDTLSCPATTTGDTRLWPPLPDGTLGGSSGSLGDQLQDGMRLSGASYNLNSLLVKSLWSGFVPRHSVSAMLSTWMDIDGDGVVDWVTTPSMIEHFTHPLACGGILANKPEMAGTDWYVAPGRESVGASAGIEAFTAKKWQGPPAPVGAPLSFSVEAGQSANFGITIPVTALVAAAASGFEARSIPGLAGAVFASGSGPGVSVSSSASLSPTAGLAMVLGIARGGDKATAVADFLRSVVQTNLDVTILSGGNHGRSQTWAELLDMSADGLPDYLLYDSSTGDLLLYVNDGKGSFGTGQRINGGSPTGYGSTVARVFQEAQKARTQADIAFLGMIACYNELSILSPGVGCAAMNTASALALLSATNTANEARSFLDTSTDALPEDKAHPNEILALVGTAINFAPAAILAVCPAPGIPLPLHAIMCPGPATYVSVVEDAARTADLTARTVAQLAYPSLLNLIAKGGSEMDAAWIGNDEGGIAVQTSGLLDLNGDGLPDYVITRDAQKSCGTDEWEVYWGRGTSGLVASSRAFDAAATCVVVPSVPVDVQDRGFDTLPMHVDFIRRRHPAQFQTSDLIQTFVALLDFNQDGRPDIVIANGGGTWDPDAANHIWQIYLNSGRGFDHARPLVVPSVSGVARGVVSAFDAPYPGIKTGLAYDPPTGQRRTTTHLRVVFLDVDQDGTADIAQRVRHSPANGVERAGIQYWTRGGSDPQDLLVEVVDAITGSRTGVRYAPTPLFQWKNAKPNGQAPAGGHRPAVGAPSFLVRSITTEPLIGRAIRRTAAGYDFKDPAFDVAVRAFLGFGSVRTTLADPGTGDDVDRSTSMIDSSAQGAFRDGILQRRTVDNMTGAPIKETLYGRDEVATAPAQATGAPAAWFTPTTDVVEVEFPPHLTEPALIDVGFDGLRPFDNRARRGAGAVSTAGQPVFDVTAPTGGAVVLDGVDDVIQYPSPFSAAPAEVTIEAWLKPEIGARGTIARIGEQAEIAVEATGDVRFGVDASGWGHVNGGKLTAGSWAHVAGSWDGSTLRIFVDGVMTASVAKSGSVTALGPLRIGCAWDAATLAHVDCLKGQLGELRVYSEAWRGPARLSWTRTDYRSPMSPQNPGMPIRTWSHGDLATDDDDIYEELEYAVPLSTSGVHDRVAKTTRRVLGTTGVPAAYLGYSETYYDSLPLGQVGAGNPTKTSVYSGPAPVAGAPTADTESKTRYTDPKCPGQPTEGEDPLGAVTTTVWDSTCSFQISVTDALGHTEMRDYFGVADTSYTDSVTGYSGRHGQLRSVKDANGAETRIGYDRWGRETTVLGPYDSRPNRPGTKKTYRDAICENPGKAGIAVSCDGKDVDLAQPPRVTEQMWDDIHLRYRTSYLFADGQAQREVIRKGAQDWLISGTEDYDVLGRALRAYKPSYLSATQAQGGSCPAPGTWCDSERMQGDPLRSPASVAQVQTAFDSRGHIIRAYGPDVPPCADPSAPKIGGGLLCDDVATYPPLRGRFTQFEYPAPGVMRTIDASGVPAVLRKDVNGRTTMVEEWTKAGTQPYSTATYKYDRDGRVVELVDSRGNKIVTTYDALGRRTATTDPDLGAWKYAYDKVGRLTHETNTAGGIAKHSYDALGRVTRSEYYSPPQTFPQHRNYTFDGGSADSDTTHRVFAYGSLLWRKAAQFENQERFWARTYMWDAVALAPLPLTYGTIDEGVGVLALPFDFVLTPNKVWTHRSNDGYTVTPIPAKNLFLAGHQVYVGTNGRIRFDAAGASDVSHPSSNRSLLPVAGNGQIGIWALWHDLVMDNGMSYAVVGAAPKRRLIVQWDGYFWLNGPGHRALFRAVLIEGTNEVQLHYATLPWFGSKDATIGIQNHSSTLAEAAGFEALDFWGNRVFVSSGTALTSFRSVPNKLLQFNDGTNYAKTTPVFGLASFDVDLSDAQSASLSFKSSWNTRCAAVPRGQCTVDVMRVEYWAGGSAPMETLLTHEALTGDAGLSAGVASGSLPSASAITVPLPASLMGDPRVTVYFHFNSVTPASADPRYGWWVDDIRVAKTVQMLEDVVEHEYDSVELRLDYEKANPLLDLTFDVPGRIEDRTRAGRQVVVRGAKPTSGRSGRGLLFDGASWVAVSAGQMAPRKTLTVEAWVRPSASGAEQTVVAKRGTFALTRTASGVARCSAVLGGAWYHASGTTALPEGTWTHLALTYDGTYLSCFVNGAQDGALAYAAPLGWTAADILIGTSGRGKALIGGADEVRVFGVARTSAQILGDARSPLRSGPPRGNVLDLGFANPGNIGEDLSGAGNHALPVHAAPTPGVEGTALRFASAPGTTGRYVEVPSAPSLQSDTLTAEAWIKTAMRDDRLLVGKWRLGEPGWRLAINRQSGQLRFEVATRAVSPHLWNTWAGTTASLSPQGSPSCGAAASSPTAKRTWVAPATGSHSFSTVGGSSWNTVIFVQDASGAEVACNDNSSSTLQSIATISAQQGETFEVFMSGFSGASGLFTMTVTGPPVTLSSFVTLERVTDDRWHHVAGVYDGESLRVFIDGTRALRTCTSVEGGDELTCRPPPIDRCSSERRAVQSGDPPVKRVYGNGVCVTGTIVNNRPLYAGAYSPTALSLEGLEDEIRVSNYAKRDFEVAASARMYSEYTGTLGLETGLRNRSSHDRFSYDLLGGRVTIERNMTFASVSTGVFLSREALDRTGRLGSRRYPVDGEVVVNEYDSAGTLTGLIGYGDFAGPGGTFGLQPYLVTTDVGPSGKTELLEYGNGVETTLSYDHGPSGTSGAFGNELLSHIRTTLPGGAVLQDESYTYDEVGNLVARIGTPSALHTLPSTSTYTYDDLNRLATFEIKFGPTVVSSGSYRFDELGNLLSKESATLTYGGPRPHAVTQVTKPGQTTNLSYDANGFLAARMTGAMATTYTHSTHGHLTHVVAAQGTFEFGYDGNGARSHKVEPAVGLTTESFPYYRQTPSGSEKYYFANGRRIARRVSWTPAEIYWYHPDHLGGTTFMTDVIGTEVQEAYSEYLPFGSALPTGPNNGGTLAGVNTPVAAADRSGGFQYTGKELDDTGLYDFGVRYYDPELGRFIEPDPAIPGQGAQSLNRYSYVLNNPLKYLDPDGREPSLRSAFWSGFASRGADYGLGMAKSSLKLSIGLLIPPVGAYFNQQAAAETVQSMQQAWKDAGGGAWGLGEALNTLNPVSKLLRAGYLADAEFEMAADLVQVGDTVGALRHATASGGHYFDVIPAAAETAAVAFGGAKGAYRHTAQGKMTQAVKALDDLELTIYKVQKADGTLLARDKLGGFVTTDPRVNTLPRQELLNALDIDLPVYRSQGRYSGNVAVIEGKTTLGNLKIPDWNWPKDDQIWSQWQTGSGRQPGFTAGPGVPTPEFELRSPVAIPAQPTTVTRKPRP